MPLYCSLLLEVPLLVLFLVFYYSAVLEEPYYSWHSWHFLMGVVVDFWAVVPCCCCCCCCLLQVVWNHCQFHSTEQFFLRAWICQHYLQTPKLLVVVLINRTQLHLLQGPKPLVRLVNFQLSSVMEKQLLNIFLVRILSRLLIKSATLSARAWWSKKSISKPFSPWLINSSTGAVAEPTMAHSMLIASSRLQLSTNG